MGGLGDEEARESRGNDEEKSTASESDQSQAGCEAQDNIGHVYALEPTQLKDREERQLEQFNLSLTHLTGAERCELEKLILSYHDVFALDPSELGTNNVTNHTTNKGGHRPIRLPPRCMPFALRGQVDNVIKGMLEQRAIVPSASPWASPVVLVRKKDGGMCF